jgi:TRAP-type C4-dicarboxylate transport system permease small subunit
VTKARKQANFRAKVAGLFFIFLLINIAMKLTGFSHLDDSQALTASHALGMKVTYYAVPIFFLCMSLLFVQLSRRKSAEAESIEIGGCSW